tara:strand:- start:196 stop:366 length:171 start_codon:yes stop_codon:yes gene_type:complete
MRLKEVEEFGALQSKAVEDYGGKCTILDFSLLDRAATSPPARYSGHTRPFWIAMGR